MDDVFFDDSEIDIITAQRRLADNEIKRKEKDMWNHGYLAGLEFAEANYLDMELTK